MRCYHVFTALVLAVLVLASAVTTANADIVDLSNGARLPKKKKITSLWGEYPTDKELRASGSKNLKLAYDAFEIDGRRGDAAQVVTLYVTEALLNNHDFAVGDQNGVRGYWLDAAEQFRLAAEDLNGAAKQVALYKRMRAAANTGDQALTLRAADELLAAAPKTYYYGPAQETRARVFAQKGRLNEALVALKMAADAPGMNVRDLYNAKYLSTWLRFYVSATTPDQYARAEKEFRSLLEEIEKHPRRALAQIPKLKVMMSLAASVRSQGRVPEAKKLFGDTLAKTDDRTDKTVLAGVYGGLGDVAFAEAAALQAKAQQDASLKPDVVEAWKTAVLHYLRVILLYKDFAGQRELFGATRGAAQVFRTLFDLSDGKDCELASRSYDYYVDAVRMQPRGEARRLLVSEGKALKKRIDELCKEDTESKK